MHLNDLRTPCPDLQGVDAYAPFTYSGYSHGRALNVLSPEFKAVKAAVASGYDLPLYAPSPVRPGLAVWDLAAGLPACVWRTVIDKPFNAKPCRNSNHYFDTITSELMRSGPIDRNRWRRPKGKYILDLPSNPRGWELLMAAEVMAQHELLNVPRGPQLCERIRLWLARFHLGLVLDVPVFDGTWDCYSAGEMLPGSGVMIATAIDAYRPTATVPMSGIGSPVPDVTVAVVSVGLAYSKLPAGFLKATGVHTAATRWACSPITSVIAGWLPVHAVTHMPIAQSNESYILHYRDLDGSDTLPPFESTAGLRVWELLDSPMYAKLYENSHPHPPPDALLIRNDVNTGLIRPKGKCPEPLNPKAREHQPWLDYKASLSVIRELVVAASDAFERSRRIGVGWQGLARLKPEKRRANYNKLVKLLDQKESYESRRKRKQKEGYLYEARKYQAKIEAVEKEIADALKVKEEVS